MDNQLKQDFTRRLSQCNQGGMIIIVYDIFFAYIEDVKRAAGEQDREAFKISIRKAQNTLDELMRSLDFKYDIAKTLCPIYLYCKNNLAKAIYENKLDKILEAEQLMKRLYSSFEVAAEQDKSMPVMSNTQQVYAGMTYGKFDLNESYMDNSQRGFFV